MTLGQIIEKANETYFTWEEVEAFCAEHDITVETFWNDVARWIATGYTSGRLTFSFCSGVMDSLFSDLVFTAHPFQVSNYCFSVFGAFDRGEHRHPNDPLDVSPEELYTKPLIAEIMASGKEDLSPWENPLPKNRP
jgi:hypothetical protein